MRDGARSLRRPSGPTGPGRRFASAGRGGAHATAGRLAEAAAAYARAERADPDDFRAPYLAGHHRPAPGPAETARCRGCGASSALQPALFDAWHNLGAVAQALELWDEAARAYGRALALRPDAAETRRNLAIVLAVLGPHRRGDGAAPASGRRSRRRGSGP